MALPYFTDLRSGKLSIRRLQGWARQHYLHNVALLKGFALCMVKNSHDPDLFKYFLYQMNEEQYHPDLAKKFGLAIGLQEKDFERAAPIFECLSHTAKTIHGMLLGSASENRASALVNETMVCRYSEEHMKALRKHYGLNDKAIQFFTVHAIADQAHTAMASELIAKHANTERQQQLVGEAARHWCAIKSPTSKESTRSTRNRKSARRGVGEIESRKFDASIICRLRFFPLKFRILR